MTALALWRLTKPFLPYIAGVLLLIGLVIWIDHRGYDRGFHKRDVEVQRITLDRDTHASNERVLQAALDRQNAAVAAIKTEADERAAQGAQALSEARKANMGLKQQADALRRSAGLKYGKDAPCVASDALAAIGKL